jgi:hypothetical protein
MCPPVLSGGQTTVKFELPLGARYVTVVLQFCSTSHSVGVALGCGSGAPGTAVLRTIAVGKKISVGSGSSVLVPIVSVWIVTDPLPAEKINIARKIGMTISVTQPIREGMKTIMLIWLLC